MCIFEVVEDFIFVEVCFRWVASPASSDIQNPTSWCVASSPGSSCWTEKFMKSWDVLHMIWWSIGDDDTNAIKIWPRKQILGEVGWFQRDSIYTNADEMSPDFLEHYESMQHIGGCHNPGSQWTHNKGPWIKVTIPVSVMAWAMWMLSLQVLDSENWHSATRRKKRVFPCFFNFLDVCAIIYPLTTSFLQHLRAGRPCSHTLAEVMLTTGVGNASSIACSTGRRFAHTVGWGEASAPCHCIPLWWTLD